MAAKAFRFFMDAERIISKEAALCASMLVSGLDFANSESQTGQGDSLRTAINVSDAKFITAR